MKIQLPVEIELPDDLDVQLKKRAEELNVTPTEVIISAIVKDLKRSRSNDEKS